MKILSHRGMWKTREEQNSREAFKRSFTSGFGTETDVRDLNGVPVISHDPPLSDAKPLTFEKFLLLYKETGDGLQLALNVKSDGIQPILAKILAKVELEDYFFFDMSIPDTLGYADADLPYLIRQSEFESKLPAELYESADGVWMDEFLRDWITPDPIEAHLNAGKRVCIVSPELHRRDHMPRWKSYKSWRLQQYRDVSLCTDYPEKARDFFPRHHP